MLSLRALEVCWDPEAPRDPLEVRYVSPSSSSSDDSLCK